MGVGSHTMSPIRFSSLRPAQSSFCPSPHKSLIFAAESVWWVKNSHLFFWQKAGSQVNIHAARKFPCGFSGSRSRQRISPVSQLTVHDHLDHRSTEHSGTFWSRKRRKEHITLHIPSIFFSLLRWTEDTCLDGWNSTSANSDHSPPFRLRYPANDKWKGQLNDQPLLRVLTVQFGHWYFRSSSHDKKCGDC